VAIAFLETQFDPGIIYESKYSLRFLTDLIRQGDGLEQARVCWEQPLVTVTLGSKLLNNEELTYLIDFHTATKGAGKAFRVKDWSDYRVTGSPVAPVVPQNEDSLSIGNGTTQTWQLIKRYQTDLEIVGLNHWVDRPITKPVPGTVKIYVNGVETLTGWSVDTTNGLLTTTLTGAITWDGEFDVPVAFDQDKINKQLVAYEPIIVNGQVVGSRSGYRLDNVSMTEVRVQPGLYYGISEAGLNNFSNFGRVIPLLLPIVLNHFVDDQAWVDLETTGGDTWDTGIQQTASEWADRKSYRDYPYKEWDIGGRTLLRRTLDRFIAFFRLCRGRAVTFVYFDRQDGYCYVSRFSEDQISFEFKAYQASDQEVIFQFGGIGVRQCEPRLFSGGNYKRNWRVVIRRIITTVDGDPISDTEDTIDILNKAIGFILFKDSGPGISTVLGRNWGVNQFFFTSSATKYEYKFRDVYGPDGDIINVGSLSSVGFTSPYKRLTAYVTRIEPI
jgi:uncharacterized protein (TIGR02217 family)